MSKLDDVLGGAVNSKFTNPAVGRMNAARGGNGPSQGAEQVKPEAKQQRPQIGKDRSQASFDAVASAIQQRAALSGNIGWSARAGKEDDGGQDGLGFTEGAFHPPGGGGSSPTGKLVSWGGYQYDSGVVGYMQTLASQFGLKPSSGYRDPERNAAAGGVANSNHLTGRAGDFSGSASAMQKGAAWARSNGAREVLIHNAGSGTHLHVAW